MSPKKQKTIDYNKSTILNAARKLFQIYGVSKTTVNEIACKADCSKATIYVYFKSKDDIYCHIILEYMVLLRDEIKNCLSDCEDIKSGFIKLCNALVEFDECYPMYFECILGEISVEKEDFDKLPVLNDIYNVGEQINEIIKEYIENAKSKGYIDKKTDSFQATFVLLSSICGLISVSTKKQRYIEQRMGTVRRTFLNNGFEIIYKMIVKADK